MKNHIALIQITYLFIFYYAKLFIIALNNTPLNNSIKNFKIPSFSGK